MNTYKKYCPNVFIALCTEAHEKGEIITLTTKYGKENEHEVHNFLGQNKEGKFMYSITRVDGFDARERAKRKANKLKGYAKNANERSNKAYNNRASKAELEFMKLGEPIKVGHHSEKRHRKIYEKYDRQMRKSIDEQGKAKAYRQRAEYWEAKTDEVNLSMPDSLEFFEIQLKDAIEYHKFLKDNPNERPHSMSLQYANKKVKELREKVETAIELWGSEEEVKQIMNEKKTAAEEKARKSKKMDALIDEYGGFFAFNKDQLR